MRVSTCFQKPMSIGISLLQEIIVEEEVEALCEDIGEDYKEKLKNFVWIMQRV